MDKHATIEKLARESHEKGGFNGAWLYAEKGGIVSKGACGFCDPEDTQPLTEDTIFQLASVSKQFTATAVMLAVRRGLFNLEDRITRYFPELTAYGDVTVRRLLSHTGGVPDYFSDVDWFVRIWKEENRVPGNGEIVRFLCETKLKPEFAPGEEFSYSNTGYNLLALLVERLSGVPYEEFLQQNVFEPAGMTSTRACHIRRDGIPFENYARATVYEDGRYVADVDSGENREVIALDGLNGDDYVYTNIFDMFRWDRALRAGKVLTLEEQRLMYTPEKLVNGKEAVFDEDEGLGYGFGWGVGRDEKLGPVVGHSGGMPGVGTWFERFLDADRVLVFLSNRDSEDARAFWSFEKALEAIARDREPDPVKCLEDVVIRNPDKSGWESFCGKYERPADDDFFVDEVWMQDGELYARAFDDEDDEMKFRLYPIGENEFGRKGGMVRIGFTSDGLTVNGGKPSKKL